MKLVAKYVKPFALLVLFCLVLLFGQAMCDLSLPNLMSDMVNIGIQQGGMDSSPPEAMSQKAMTLLQLFMTQEEKEETDGDYSVIEPESSEAQRLSEKYPLARKETVCVLREGLEEEKLTRAGKACGKAAYAFLMYLGQAQESGELEGLARQASPAQGFGEMPDVQENSGFQDAPDKEEGESPFSSEGEASPPDGVIGPIPEGAVIAGEEELTTAKTSVLESSANFLEEEDREGEHHVSPDSGASSESAEETPSQEGNFGISQEDGISGVSMEQLYPLLPLLSQAPPSSVAEAVEAAGQNASMMGDQVGVAFKKLFYEELGMDTDAIRSQYIWATGLKMLGVAFLGVAAAVLVGLFSSRIAAAVGKRLRRDVFSKVEGFSNAEFDRFSTASLITRTTNDVQQVQMLITMGIRMVCYAPIIGIGGIIFALGKSVSMSWIVAAAVVVMLGLIIVALAVALPRFKSLQKLIDRLNLVSREHLSGMMVVRAFGNEAYEEGRFAKANRDLADTTQFVQRVMSLMMPAMMFVMNLVSIVIVWVGGHAIADSTLQVGDMMAFIQYAMQIIMAFLMIAGMFIMVPRASVSAARISEVLDAQPEISDAPETEALEQVRGKIEFKDVSFRYGGAEDDALQHISFTAEPGETTAFIGATGSGKSTLVNLIPRFYDVTQGEIDLDGVDVRRLSQKQLRDSIGYVPQRGILFSGTIESNIRYGKEEAAAEEINAALETAQAREFVDSMERGVESPISQGGTNVSGGQKQRLSIARALVRKPSVYIFDDSFSALDFKTDAALRRALKEYTAEATVILVAQRVSTIMHAQQIIVLDGGRIVGRGTHGELLKNCPEYREIAESQLQKEELE